MDAALSIGDQWIQVALFWAFALCVLGIAWGLGYFRSSHSSLPRSGSPMTATAVFGVGVIYLLFLVLVVPLLAQGYLLFFHGWGEGEKTLGEKGSAWVGVIAALFLATTLHIYSRIQGPAVRQEVWGASRTQWKRDMALGAASWLISFPCVVAFGRLVGLFVELFVRAEGEQLAVTRLKESLDSPLLGVLTFASIISAVPLAEEIFFRGFIQNYLRKYLSRVSTISVSALIFTSFHFASSQGLKNLELLASLWVLALFLGWLYERQRSLWAPLALHMVFNFVSGVWIILENGA